MSDFSLVDLLVIVLKHSKNFLAIPGSLKASTVERLLIMSKKSISLCICTVLKVNKSFKRENPKRKTKSFVETK